MTVPNEALSIEEMFKRFSRGQSITTTQREPIFNSNPTHEDTDLEKLKTADLVDKQEFSEALGEKMIHLDKKIKDDKALEDKKREEDAEREFDEKLAKRQKRDTDKNKPTEPGVTPH